MALCEQCGSIQVVKAHRNTVDKAVAMFSGRRAFVCRRCGWRARRAWTDNDLAKLADYSSSGFVEVDPALVTLDDPLGRRKQPEPKLEGRDASRTEFELSILDLAQPVSENERAVGRHRRHRITARRLKRWRRREILTAITVSTLAMFLIALLVLTGSCIRLPGSTYN